MRFLSSGVMAFAVTGFAVLAALGACADRTGPPPAPILARPLGGDSLSPGPMVTICLPDDVGCVPTYAVACEAEWVGDSTPNSRAAKRPLSPEEQAWCVAH